MNKNLWLVLAVVASGCYVEINSDKGDSGDTGLPNDGSSPACEIVSPADGDILGTGLPILLEGTATDAESASEKLTVEWASSISGELGASTPAEDGTFVLETSALAAGSHVLTLTVTDPSGSTCVDEVAVEVQGLPGVQITSPIELSFVPEGDLSFTGLVGDLEDAAETLTVVWEDDIVGVLDTTAPAADGSVGFTTSALESGVHTVTLSATDSTGLTGSASVTFTVDDAPTMPEIMLDPALPTTLDDLMVTIVTPSTDAELSAITYTYEWSVDTVVSGASTSDVLPADATTRGEVWTVTVTPNDGVQNGPAATASVTIVNAAPKAGTVDINPNPPTADDALVCIIATEATDPDGDVVSYKIAWDVGGVVYKSNTMTNLPGDTVPAAVTDPGEDWTCAVTPTDGTEDGPVRTETVIIP